MNDKMQMMQPDPALAMKTQYARDYAAYELDFAALASGATATGSIQIQADSYFNWIKGAYYATIANAAFTDQTRPIPSITMQVTDGGSGRQLFSPLPVPVPSVMGTGQLPFILPRPRMFMPRSSITITVANFDAAVEYNLRLTLIGEKIFQYG